MCVDRVTWVAVAITLLAAPVLADPSATAPAGGEVEALFPSALSTYATSDAAGSLRADAAEQPRALSRPPGLWSRDVLDDDTGGGQSWWPVVYSAVIPGLGEVTMGYWKRGVVLMAAEALAWTMYFRDHDAGLDARDAYERFADENWNQSKWVADHPYGPGYTQEELEAEGRLSSGEGRWPGYIPWVSKEEDKQHYYENIGKYDWYISGWADYDPNVDPPPRDTALRDQYRAMRQDSNDKLDAATTWVYLSLTARVISLVQTTLLVHQANHPKSNGQAMTAPLENQLTIRARARGVTGGEVALEYWFK